MELVLQALIEAEATEVIGATRSERSDTRATQRNGSREQLLTTKAGDVELRIAKLRRGSFFPSILERRQRIDRDLFAVVMEAYVQVVPVRENRSKLRAEAFGEQQLAIAATAAGKSRGRAGDGFAAGS